MAQNVFAQTSLESAMGSNPLGATRRPEGDSHTSLKSILEGVAQRHNVPVNVLIALEESTGVGDPAQAAERADQNAADIARAMQGGASVDDVLIGRFGKDLGPRVANRAYDIADELYPRTDREEPGMIGDFGRQLGGSLVKAGGAAVKGVGEAVDATANALLPKAMEVETTAASRGLDVGADWLKRSGENVQAGVSRAGKMAIRNSSPDGDLFKPSTWTFGEEPSFQGYALLGADVLGSFLPTVATAVLTKNPYAAAAVGGMIGGGAGADTARDIVLQMAEEKGPDGRPLIETESAYYVEAIKSGKSPEEALSSTIEAAERFAFLLTFPISALGGAATEKLLNPGVRALVAKGVASRIGGRAALSALEEGVQESAETIATRVATGQAAGADIDPTEGTFGDFILGALGGAGPGAVSGIQRPGLPDEQLDQIGKEESDPTLLLPPPDAQNIDPAASAVDEEILGGTPVVTEGGTVAPEEPTAGGVDDATVPDTFQAPVGPDVVNDPVGVLEDAALSVPVSDDVIDDMPVDQPQRFPDQKPGKELRLTTPDGLTVDAVFLREDQGGVIVRIAGDEIAIDSQAFDAAVIAARKADDAQKKAEKLAQKAKVTGNPTPPPAELPSTAPLSEQLSANIKPPADRQRSEMTPEEAARRMKFIENQAGSSGWNKRLQRLHSDLAKIAGPDLGTPDIGTTPSPAVEDKTTAPNNKAVASDGVVANAIGTEGVKPSAGYQALPTPDYDSLTPGAFAGTRTEFESLTPGMRREIVRTSVKKAVVDAALSKTKEGTPKAAPKALPIEAIKKPVKEKVSGSEKAGDGDEKPAPSKSPEKMVKLPGGNQVSQSEFDRREPARKAQKALKKGLRVEWTDDGFNPPRVRTGTIVGMDRKNYQGTIDVKPDNGATFNGGADVFRVISDKPKTSKTPVVYQKTPVGVPQTDLSDTKAPQSDPVTAKDVSKAAREADRNPSQAQKEAGNYKMGHLAWNGLDITIENAKGSMRKGVDPDGEVWSVKMPAHYGYIKQTEGADGDHVDVYMGDNPESDVVVVVDQVDAATKKFDEHKVMLGFVNRKTALDFYVQGFSDGKGADRMGGHKIMTVDEFKSWLVDGDQLKPVRTIEKEPTPADPVPNKQANPQKLEDFGEKIEGAAKDRMTDYKAKVGLVADGDIVSEPLSKIFPEPDYQALLDEGANPWSVAFIRAVRDMIPTKPRKGWRLKGWVDQVTVLRGFAMNILNQVQTREEIEAKLDQPDFKRLRDLINGSVALYTEMGHAVSLKGVRISPNSYSMRAGVRYSPSLIVWEVTQNQKASAFSNMPRTLAEGKTRDEALAAFKAKFSGTDALGVEEKKRSGPKFVVYAKRSRKDNEPWHVGVKMGRDHISLAVLPTIKEARAYIVEKRDDLLAELAKLKTVPGDRRSSNSPRVGADHRMGVDVTPELFSETFGFRGVQFGNYVEGSKRQTDLNQAYDGFLDMAGILDIPAKAISLNGQLALAFGARGRGGVKPAAAHYEHDEIVINLTKANGSGSLAHEWFHAIDNDFERRRGNKRGYLTDRPNPLPGNENDVRPELLEAFRAVRKAIDETSIKARSTNVDKYRSSPYWATGIEMHARAFESYVIAKLQDISASNDYLANITSEAMWEAESALSGRDGPSYPYATAAEVPVIREAFDTLFSVVESRETDRGVELFQKPETSETASQPIPAATVAKMWPKLRAELDRLRLNRVRLLIDEKGILDLGDAQGAFLRNSQGAMAIAINASLDPMKTLHHEVIHALRSMNLFTVEEWVALETKARRTWIRQYDIEARYPGLPRTMQIEEAIAEAFADAAATQAPVRGNFTSKAFAKIAKFFAAVRSVFEGAGFSTPESVFGKVIAGEISKRNAENGGAQALFQKAPPTNSDAFKAWFGDSKVVDADGKPLVVYHGTTSEDFESFSNVRRSGKEIGIFFSDDPKISDLYAGYDPDSAFAPESAGRVIPVYLSIKNPLVVDLEGSKYGRVDAIRRAKNEGYDGVIIKNNYDAGGVQDQYVAFNPTQIKSVNNRGTFDANDPRILYQLAYHGTPHQFDKFSLDHIGTGEGAQSYGWGLYFAGRKGVAQYYRDALSNETAAHFTMDGKRLSPAQIDELSMIAGGMSNAVQIFLGSSTTRNALKRGNDGKFRGVVRSAVERHKQAADILRDRIKNHEDRPPFSSTYSPQQLRERLAWEEKQAEDIQAFSDSLTFVPKASKGSLFKVDVPEDSDLLVFDARLGNQPEAVQEKLAAIGFKVPDGAQERRDAIVNEMEAKSKDRDKNNRMVDEPGWHALAKERDALDLTLSLNGKAIYEMLAFKNGRGDDRSAGDKAASLALRDAGIPGHRYLDGGSRADGDGSYNYVIYDEAAVSVLEFDPADPRVLYQAAPSGAEKALSASLLKSRAKSLLGKAHWRKPDKSFFSDLLTDAMSGQASLLAVVPGRALFTELGKNLMSARAYLRGKEEMDALRNDWHGKADDVAQQWLTLRRKDQKTNDAFMDLMHQSTLAGVDPSKPEDWKHPRERQAREAISRLGRSNPDAKWAEAVMDEVDARSAKRATMTEKFDALPSEFQELYGKVLAAYGKMGDDFEKAILENIRNAQKISIKRAERTYRKEVQRIDDEGLEGDERQEALDAAWRSLKNIRERGGWGMSARIALLRNTFESNRLQGPYFPLARFGGYFVTIRDADGKVMSFSRFEKRGEQRRFASAAEADNPGRVQTGIIGDAKAMRDQVDPTFVADVQQMLGEFGADANLMDAVWQRWLETLPDQSIRTSKIHRKGRTGFSNDAYRAFGHHMFHGAHQLARLKYGMQLEEHLSIAEEEAGKAADPVRAGLVVNEMRKRHEFTMNPTGGPIAATLGSLAFVWYLGATPGAAIANLSQTSVVGIPLFMARFKDAGMGKITRHMFRASKDFAKGRGHTETSESLTPKEKAALGEAIRRGTIDKTQAHDLAAVAETGIEYSGARERVMRKISFFFHHAERFNREVTFLTGYRLAIDAGQTQEEAIETGADMTWKIHFDYQNTSRPRLMQNDAMKILTIFRQFTVNMLWRLYRDTHQSMKGSTEAERSEARRQLVGVTLSLMAHAGIRGVWGYGIITGLLGVFFPGGGDDVDDWLHDALLIEGDDMGTAAWNYIMGAALNGVPGQVGQVDMRERIGMPHLWFRPPSRDLEGEDLYAHWVGEILGPIGGLSESWFRSMKYMTEGDIWRGTEAALPKFARDLMKAGRYAVDGVETRRGDPLIESVNPWQVLVQASGFTPAQVSERYEINNRLMNAQKRIVDRRQQIHKEATEALKNQTPLSKALIEKIWAFNKEFPEYPITPKTIKQSFTSRLRMSERKEFGVALNPKLDTRLRGELPPSVYN